MHCHILVADSSVQQCMVRIPFPIQSMEKQVKNMSPFNVSNVVSKTIINRTAGRFGSICLSIRLFIDQHSHAGTFKKIIERSSRKVFKMVRHSKLLHGQ